LIVRKQQGSYYMKVIKHDSTRKLESILKLKTNAEIRDRIRAVVFAISGKTAPWIADRLGYSPRWPQRWVKRYNENGLDGLRDSPREGQPMKLNEEQILWLQNRLEAGPLPTDEMNVFRGEDVVEILNKQFGVNYSLSGVYLLLSKLGYAYIKPRPIHPKNNPEEMAVWLKKNHAKLRSKDQATTP
jgi:transposase